MAERALDPGVPPRRAAAALLDERRDRLGQRRISSAPAHSAASNHASSSGTRA